MEIIKNICNPTLSSSHLKSLFLILHKIWESRQLTNIGPFHEELEKQLEEYLGVKYVSLVVNGTVALMLALKALDIRGRL